MTNLKFGTEVRIKSGFYEGLTGKLIKHISATDCYVVRPFIDAPCFEVHENGFEVLSLNE